MLVKILKIFHDSKNNLVKVEFFYTLRNSIYTSKEIRNPDDSVNLVGTWMGRRFPEKGTWYEVEIAVKEKLVWDRDVSPANTADAWIKTDNDGSLRIQGLIEAEENDMHTLRIGTSLIALEINGIPKSYSGFVQFRAKEIMVYDTDTIKF